MNRVTRVLWPRLGMPERLRFARAARMWRMFVTDECAVIADRYRGGTAWGVAHLDCKERLAAARLSELEYAAAVWEPH
jgi:uncharacterized protein YecT (DUF1311 family)